MLAARHDHISPFSEQQGCSTAQQQQKHWKLHSVASVHVPARLTSLLFKLYQLQIIFSMHKTGACIVLFLSYKDIILLVVLELPLIISTSSCSNTESVSFTCSSSLSIQIGWMIGCTGLLSPVDKSCYMSHMSTHRLLYCMFRTVKHTHMHTNKQKAVVCFQGHII